MLQPEHCLHVGSDNEVQPGVGFYRLGNGQRIATSMQTPPNMQATRWGNDWWAERGRWASLIHGKTKVVSVSPSNSARKNL